MELRLLMGISLLFAITVDPAVSLAEPSCTAWMAQSNGTQWRTCVDDRGQQYCEELKDNRITRVNCR